MLKRYLIIIITTILLAGGCTSPDTPQILPDAAEKSQLEMYLTVGSGTAGSRALSDGEYNSGEGYENYIDVENFDFRFYFFDSDNRYLAPLEVSMVLPIESTSTSKTYFIRSFAFEEAISGSVKIVALANWPEYPDEASLEKGITSIDDIVTMQYSFDASRMQLSEDVTIPLYGVTNSMTLTYDATNTANVGTIHMLRAYAKVEVTVDDDCPFTTEWVRLSRYNSRGFCAPGSVYSQNDYVGGSYDTDYTRQPCVPAEAETDGEIDFIKADDNRWVAYIPEYTNVGRTENNRTGILIKLNGEGYSDVSRLEFAYYNTDEIPNTPGEYFNVMRNYYYKYKVNKRSLYADIECSVDVQPYGLVELTPEFGLERDSDGNIIVRNKAGEVVKIVQSDKTELTFESFQVESIGSATGVFNSNNNVVMAYLSDGRLMIYTYASGKFKIDMTDSEATVEKTDELIRWEIYSNEDKAGSNFVNDFFLEEEYEKYRYDWATNMFWPGNLHNYYDDGGNLIRRYTYTDHEAFTKRPVNGDSSDAVLAIDYTGSRYSDKVVTYYHYLDDGTAERPIQVTIKKVYKQKLDNNKDPMWEIEGYEEDEDGELILDENGKPIPIYATENGEKVKVMEYRYEEVYEENLDPILPQRASLPSRSKR